MKGSRPDTIERREAVRRFLRTILEREGITQREFGVRLGWAEPVVSNLFTGAKLPSRNRARAIAAEFGVSESSVLTGEVATTDADVVRAAARAEAARDIAAHLRQVADLIEREGVPTAAGTGAPSGDPATRSIESAEIAVQVRGKGSPAGARSEPRKRGRGAG